MRTLRYASLGLLLGVAWGVVARVWMRLISTSPEFSWAGTLSIIMGAGIVGLALGLIHAARRRGGSQWWRLLVLVVILFFQGQGLPLLPAVVLGGWGLRRGVFGRVLAVFAFLSAPALLIALSWGEIDTYAGPYPLLVSLGIALGGVLVLVVTAGWGSSTALGPWEGRKARLSTGRSEPAEVTA